MILGALIRDGLNNGDAVGPYRVTGALWHWPEHRLYRATLAGEDKPFLLRELLQVDDPLRAKRRWALEAERFALAHGALPRTLPHHLTFVEYIEEGGGFATFAHRDLERLTGNAADAEIADEAALRRLVAPALAVLHELHRHQILCCSMRAEEILIDPEGRASPVFAGLQHVYHLRGAGPQRPGRDEAGVFAPEFAERQKPLTPAADVYALAALMFSLLGAGAETSLGDEAAVRVALSSVDAARCSPRLRDALIASLNSGPAMRPQSIAEFEDLAFGAQMKRAVAIAFPARRRITASLAPPLAAHSAAARSADESEKETLPPWPPIRAYLDAKQAGNEPAPRAGRAANSSEPREDAPPSELRIAAKRFAASLTECALAPVQLARSTAGEVQTLARKTSKAFSKAVAHVRSITAETWRTNAIGAAAVVIAIIGVQSIGSLKSSTHAALADAPRKIAAFAASLPLGMRAEAAVQDEVISDSAERALKPQMLMLAAEPVMFALPAPRPLTAEAAGPPRQSDPIVSAVQARLKRLKLYGGPADGVLGPQTRSAILAAQRALHQDETGEPSPRFVSALQDLKLAPIEIARATFSKRQGARDASFQAARALTRPLPNFPTDAFQQRLEGWIEVAYDVDPRGSVKHAKVVAFNNGSARDAFEREALAATGHAVYAPARKNGKSVWSRGLKVRYQFAVVNHGWGPFRSREARSSIIADSSDPSDSTLQ